MAGPASAAVLLALASPARSLECGVLLPLKAVLTNLLWWPPPTDTVTPSLLPARVFGLSMDHEVYLLPATMQLIGRWNWWPPGPPARMLPRADFEASAPERAPAKA